MNASVIKDQVNVTLNSRCNDIYGFGEFEDVCGKHLLLDSDCESTRYLSFWLCFGFYCFTFLSLGMFQVLI